MNSFHKITIRQFSEMDSFYNLIFSDKKEKRVSIQWLDAHIPSLAGPSSRWERQNPNIEIDLTEKEFKIIQKCIPQGNISHGKIHKLDHLETHELENIFYFADMHFLKIRDIVEFLIQERQEKQYFNFQDLNWSVKKNTIIPGLLSEKNHKIKIRDYQEIKGTLDSLFKKLSPADKKKKDLIKKYLNFSQDRRWQYFPEEILEIKRELEENGWLKEAKWDENKIEAHIEYDLIENVVELENEFDDLHRHLQDFLQNLAKLRSGKDEGNPHLWNIENKILNIRKTIWENKWEKYTNKTFSVDGMEDCGISLALKLQRLILKRNYQMNPSIINTLIGKVNDIEGITERNPIHRGPRFHSRLIREKESDLLLNKEGEIALTQKINSLKDLMFQKGYQDFFEEAFIRSVNYGVELESIRDYLFQEDEYKRFRIKEILFNVYILVNYQGRKNEEKIINDLENNLTRGGFQKNLSREDFTRNPVGESRGDLDELYKNAERHSKTTVFSRKPRYDYFIWDNVIVSGEYLYQANNFSWRIYFYGLTKSDYEEKVKYVKEFFPREDNRSLEIIEKNYSSIEEICPEFLFNTRDHYYDGKNIIVSNHFYFRIIHMYYLLDINNKKIRDTISANCSVSIRIPGFDWGNVNRDIFKKENMRAIGLEKLLRKILNLQSIHENPKISESLEEWIGDSLEDPGEIICYSKLQ